MAQKLPRLDVQCIGNQDGPVVIHALSAALKLADLPLVRVQAFGKLLLREPASLPVLSHIPMNGAAVSDPVHIPEYCAARMMRRHPLWKQRA